MIYCIVGLILLAVLALWLAWRDMGLRRALNRSEARCRALQKERGLRQNLQRICDGREAEIRRLRERVTKYEDDYQALETQASDLNMSLFRESGLRILAEKEDGAKRLKLEQLERQLADARRSLRERDAAAQATEQQLRGMLARQEAELARIRAVQPRRAARRAQSDAALLNQVTLDDVLPPQ